jgi:hypothetical protein
VSEETPDVAEEIRRYCVAHPRARDTLEGITWWVQMQVQNDIRNRVADAVSLLLKEGRLEEHHLQDGSVVYGCRVEAGKQVMGP